VGLAEMIYQMTDTDFNFIKNNIRLFKRGRIIDHYLMAAWEKLPDCKKEKLKKLTRQSVLAREAILDEYYAEKEKRMKGAENVKGN
jgi:hypothetical protein